MSITPFEEPESPALTIKEIMEEIRIAGRELDRFRMEHAPVLNQAALLEEALKEAKDTLAAMLAERQISFVEDDEFGFTCTAQDRGYYDLEALPASVRAMPGVVKEVADKKTIEKLLKRKRNPLSDEERAQVKAAWVAHKSKPYVTVTRKVER